MTEKLLPFTRSHIENIIKDIPTPFHIYHEKGIRENAKELTSAFSRGMDFKEYFAVKATPNPYILKILKEEGLGADCSSLPELILAEKAGITGKDIMFTSNNTPPIEFQKAMELGAIINLDDINHIPFLEKHASIPSLICFRYNPGFLREGNTIIGKPEEAKYGFTRDQLFEGYKLVRDKGAEKFGLHTMIASNELDPNYFIETASMLLELIVDISKTLGICFEFINIGGGIGIPYTLEQKKVNYNQISEGILKKYNQKIRANKLDPLKIFMENGRVITGPYGFLVSRVLHKKETHRNFIGLDASMADLMRPGIYNAYHHITVLGKEDHSLDHIYDVTGSLCENNDKFAINRNLPEIETGDLVVIHDTGAHGHAMGFNYNGKLRSAELLLKPNGKIEVIRRAENIDDYFATLDFSML